MDAQRARRPQLQVNDERESRKYSSQRRSLIDESDVRVSVLGKRGFDSARKDGPVSKRVHLEEQRRAAAVSPCAAARVGSYLARTGVVTPAQAHATEVVSRVVSGVAGMAPGVSQLASVVPVLMKAAGVSLLLGGMAAAANVVAEVSGGAVSQFARMEADGRPVNHGENPQ